MAKGIEKGMEKGELKKSLEIARAMKTKGIDLDLIAFMMGLSLDLLRREG